MRRACAATSCVFIGRCCWATSAWVLTHSWRDVRSVEMDARCSWERVDWVYDDDAAEEAEEEDSFVRRWSLDAIFLIMDYNAPLRLRAARETAWPGRGGREGMGGREGDGSGAGDKDGGLRRRPLFSFAPGASSVADVIFVFPFGTRRPPRPCSRRCDLLRGCATGGA